MVLDRSFLVRRVAEAGVDRQALAAVGLLEGPELLQWFLAGDAKLRAYVGPGPVLTDDRPTIEYFRSFPSGETPLDLNQFSRRLPQTQSRPMACSVSSAALTPYLTYLAK